MILWFGKKKKEEELKEAGAAMESPELSADELAANFDQIVRTTPEKAAKIILTGAARCKRPIWAQSQPSRRTVSLGSSWCNRTTIAKTG